MNEDLKITLDSIIGLTVTGITNNYINKTLTIYLSNKTEIIFYGCELIYNLGIVGHKIGEVSECAGLGMALELKKHSLNIENYKTFSLSRDFNDYNNKNELRLSCLYYEISNINKVIKLEFYGKQIFEFTINKQSESSIKGFIKLDKKLKCRYLKIEEEIENDNDCWYLDDKGNRLIDKELFTNSPWSIINGDKKIKILQRYFDFITGESFFNIS